MLLILDLDDTIFETKSMDMSLFDPARRVVEEFTLKQYGAEETQQIVNEIKESPFDTVADKYNIPEHIQSRFYLSIQSIAYNLNIKVYDDYRVLRQLTCVKYLVTTGITNLQKAKIDALRIAPDFQEIFIDDPFDKNRKFKKGIFQQIITGIDPKQVWVIGDNPNSELKAGKELGLNTVQRLHENIEKSAHADHVIQTFDELKNIII